MVQLPLEGPHELILSLVAVRFTYGHAFYCSCTTYRLFYVAFPNVISLHLFPTFPLPTV
jgi:hypothetical protein